MLDDLKITWGISNPPRDMISQIAKLFYEEWGDINRWLADLHFYFDEKQWKLAILKKDEQLIGVLIYKSLPLSKSVALSYLIIHKNFRGKGIGTMFMREVEEYATQIRAETVFFDSSEPIREFRRHFFIDKLKYLIPKIPVLFPDEPPVTYLFVKFLQGSKCSDPRYFKKILKEYVNESYSEDELRKYKNIFNLMFSTLDTLDSICLTRKLFLNKYSFSKYAKKPSKDFSIEDLRNFTKKVISQPCDIR